MAQEKRFVCDLLRPGILRSLFLGRLFPYVFQGGVLVVLVVLVINGWGIGTGYSSSFLKILRKTNTTTLVIWGLWWPCMVLGAILLGRAWCTICPLELVNNVAHRLGLRLGTARFKLGRVLRVGFGIFFAYVLLQILVGLFSLHRVPAYTSEMLVALVALAFALGLFVSEPRSICTGLCPANLLLPVYGRLSRFEIDVRDPAVCERCTTKDCFRPDRMEKWHGRSCPSRVRVFERQKGDPCVLCFQCAKACPHDNVGFGIVSRRAPSARAGVLTTAQALFVAIVSGFIMHELFTEIEPFERIYHFPAERLRDIAGWAPYWNWLHTGWYLLVFPALLWAVVISLGKFIGGGKSLGETFRTVATGAFPVIAAAHASKALAKLNSWSAFVPVSLSDPNGVPAARAIVEGARAAPGHLVPFTAIGWLAVVLSLLIAVFAWKRVRQLEEPSRRTAHVGLAVTAVLYCGVIFLWPWPFAH